MTVQFHQMLQPYNWFQWYIYYLNSHNLSTSTWQSHHNGFRYVFFFLYFYMCTFTSCTLRFHNTSPLKCLMQCSVSHTVCQIKLFVLISGSDYNYILLWRRSRTLQASAPLANIWIVIVFMHLQDLCEPWKQHWRSNSRVYVVISHLNSTLWWYLHPPRKLWFHMCLLVCCLSVCRQDCAKTTGSILG